MAQKTYILEGRQFRTEADYKLALKDVQLIEAIRTKLNMQDSGQIKKEIHNIETKKYPFRTLLGQDFREELEERLEQLKTPQHKKGSFQDTKLSNKKVSKKTKKKQKVTVGDEMVLRELKKQERRRRLVVFCCSIAAAGCLGYFALYSYYDYKTGKSYEQLSEMKELSVKQNQKEEKPTIHYTNTEKEIPEVLDEYKNLVNTNKKLIGWVKIDDTNIDYPVMQTTNNDYYLDHNLNQEYDKNGSIFMDKDCDVLKPSTNYIIYGHHMKSGQMFGKLDLYSSEEYYKKHKYIQFDTIYEKGTYEIMYVFRSKIYKEEEIVFKYYQFIDALSELEFQSNMREMAALSLYDTGVTAEYGDQLLTLSTCDYYVTDGRFVVVAKRIG